jgi:hypothetical protein
VVARSRPEIVVETHDWRKQVEFSGGVMVWLHPANHWSARGIADRRMALWCGYVIATPVSAVYIGGDTGSGDGRIFLEVADRFPALDVAVLPISADRRSAQGSGGRAGGSRDQARMVSPSRIGSAMGLSGARPATFAQARSSQPAVRRIGLHGVQSRDAYLVRPDDSAFENGVQAISASLRF